MRPLRILMYLWIFLALCCVVGHAHADDSATISANSAPEFLQALRAQQGGMTSEQAARLALERAPAVAAARAAALSAAHESERTKRQLVPRLDLSGSYDRYPALTQPDLSFGGMSFENPFPFLVNRYALQANLSIGVTDIFLRILPSYEASKLQVDMARYRVASERLLTAHQARQAFYDVVLTQGTLAVADDSVRVLEANLADIRALADAGVTTQSDVKRAEAQLASVRVRRARALASVEIARASFAQLVAGGEPVETRSGEDLSTEPAVDVPDAATLLQQALGARPELLALETTVDARQLQKKARRAEMLPQLSLYGNATYARPNQLIVPPTDTFRGTWQIGAQLTWSPNDILTGHASVKSGDALVSQAREDLRSLRDGVTVEVTRAYQDYKASAEAITSAREGVEAAELSFTTRRDLLNAGEATTSELLEAEAELRQAQLDLLQAHVGLRRSLAAIDAAVGRELPEHGPVAQSL